MANRGRTGAGFTLVEALVALVLLALLIALAAPTLTGWRQRQELRSLAEVFWNSLVLARAQALARQQWVTVCAQSAQGDCDAVGPWQGGWLVFVDGNRNGQYEAGEWLLQRQGALPAGITLIGNSTVRRVLAYAEEGRGVGLGGGFLAGRLTLCRQGLPEGWEVVVNAVGRPHVKPATCP
ncbi:MAG: prepilin-type cleavage/methylation domain-containing protein [Betaproteobacteria bacterium]|nr:prepilin-type cleavage/methylation domain-containing protein [Betaproteobacteria bacterium]